MNTYVFEIRIKLRLKLCVQNNTKARVNVKKVIEMFCIFEKYNICLYFS